MIEINKLWNIIYVTVCVFNHSALSKILSRGVFVSGCECACVPVRVCVCLSIYVITFVITVGYRSLYQTDYHID